MNVTTIGAAPMLLGTSRTVGRTEVAALELSIEAVPLRSLDVERLFQSAEQILCPSVQGLEALRISDP